LLRPPAAVPQLDRRSFLKAAATATGALLVSIPLPPRSSLLAATRAVAASRNGYGQWSVYLTIHPDNRVDLISPIMDMGQGTRTVGPMILADELDLDWSLIAFGRDAPVHMNRNSKGEVIYEHASIACGGSQTVRNNWVYMRRAGATVRRMLIEEAAERWKVSPDTLATSNSFVVDPSSNRRVSYGDLAAKAATRRVAADRIRMKQPSEYRIMGKDAGVVDIRDIVTGKPLFAIDEEYPNALQAVIDRAPAIGAEIASYDQAAALAVPGVRHIIELPRRVDKHWPEGESQVTAAGVAVLADSLWAAMKGRKALQTKWKNAASDDSAEQLASYHKLVASNQTATKIRDDGDVDRAFASADLVLDATYEKPLFAHACMEPLSCIADVRADGATVIAGHQVPHLAAV